MATDDALLQLIWLASPALPIGGFSYSEGIESAVDAGLVTGEESAALWLVDQLHLSLARADLAVAAQAFQAWQDRDLARVRALDGWVLHTRETSEQRQQTEQMGRSLLEWLRGAKPGVVETLHEMHGMFETQQLPEPQKPQPFSASTGSAERAPASDRVAFHLTHPVAFALAASATGATARDSLLALAFGWAENMVQATLKSVPLGQTAGQRVLGRLAAEIPAAVDTSLQLADDERQAFSPMLAILSARHETQYSRLFRS